MRYFSVSGPGIDGFLIVERDEAGRFRFQGERLAVEASEDEFGQACREQDERCVVTECAEEIEAARRNAVRHEKPSTDRHEAPMEMDACRYYRRASCRIHRNLQPCARPMREETKG